MLWSVTSKDDAVKALRRAAATRKRAQEALDRAVLAEDKAIQDAATAGAGGTELSNVTLWSREHVRKVIDPKFKRGHYADASSS